MPFVHTLDGTVPANSALVSGGAGNIRDLTAALIERLNSFFVDSNTNPLTGKTGASMAATTFTAGLTVSAGTLAAQAITAATLTATATVVAGAAFNLGWTTRSLMASPSDGIIQLTNNAGGAFTRLQLGGASNLFPALRVENSTELAAVLADASAYTKMTASTLHATAGLVQDAGTAALQAITGTTLVLSSSVTAAAFIDAAVNPAATGAIRLANSSQLMMRNASNSADIAVIGLASNVILIGGGAANSNTQFLGAPVGIGGPPATSALLDLQSTTSTLLIPRMTTTQKNAMTAVDGMVVYDTILGKFQGREGGAWANFSTL